MVAIWENNGKEELIFNDLESYDDFEEILNTLKANFKVRVNKAVDGPESRVYTIELEHHLFLLTNNPYGNQLIPESKDAHAFLQEHLPQLKKLF